MASTHYRLIRILQLVKIGEGVKSVLGVCGYGLVVENLRVFAKGQAICLRCAY